MMKNSILLLVFYVVLLIGCSSKEDYFLAPMIEIENALIFDNKVNYIVGDTIFLELNFSRYLKEKGYNELLDIYETTTAEEFLYDIEMRKFSIQANKYRFLNVDSQFLFSRKGNLYPDTNRVGAVLNTSTDMYESKVGIVLVEEGQYRMDMETFHISSNVPFDEIRLHIIHKFADYEFDRFVFSVTEE